MSSAADAVGSAVLGKRSIVDLTKLRGSQQHIGREPRERFELAKLADREFHIPVSEFPLKPHSNEGQGLGKRTRFLRVLDSLRPRSRDERRDG